MKWTIVISQFGYLAFIAANLYAQPALMYPASILVGLGGAPLWTSQSSYVTQIGTLNAELKGKKPETGITQFVGVFFAFFQTSKHARSLCYNTRRMISPLFRSNLGQHDQLLHIWFDG